MPRVSLERILMMSQFLYKARRKIVLLMVSMSLFLTSCQKATLEDVVNDTATGTSNVTKRGFSSIPEILYDFAVLGKRWAPVVIVGSILCGAVVYEIFKKNKEIQKFALVTLIIKIPVLVLVVVYMYAFLYGMLNF